jgi:hypothetical protein
MTISTEQFLSVNTGTAANDGTGDSLRAAFVKVNENFNNISDIGFDAGNINCQGGLEVSDDATIFGNVITEAYFIGDGRFLSNVTALADYTDSNVAAYLPTYSGNIADVTVTGNLTFNDSTIQTTAYAGGVGRALMIDTNRSDTYTEVGSADRPFKTFAAAIAAATASDETTFTFILMGCTVTEDVSFNDSGLTAITISTTCRSNIEGNITIADNPELSQMVVRNVEIGGTFTVTGDATIEQMNNVSFYNVSFSGPVNITATNATAFYEVSFFDVVNFTNLSYLYINGAQFNTDWTITADSDGVIPSRGINPGTGGSIAIVFSVIANNVIFVKGGTAAYVFQPHMSRMGLGAGTYTVPAGWTMTPHSTVLRGTWINNGTVAMRNSSSDLAITGVARSYTGIIGGDRVVADLVPANSTGAAGDAAGMIAVGGGYLYVCTANWASPGTADIWTRTTLTTGAW